MSAGPLAAQDTLFSGMVTNLGYDGRGGGLTGSLALIASSPDSGATRLELAIGAPLGGSGTWEGHAWADTLLLRSISPSGDSIAWLGWRATGRTVRGVYSIYGGEFRGQGGKWAGRLRDLGWQWVQGHATDPRPAKLAATDLSTAFGPFAPTRLYPTAVARRGIRPEDMGIGPSARSPYTREEMGVGSSTADDPFAGITRRPGGRPLVGVGSRDRDPIPPPSLTEYEAAALERAERERAELERTHAATGVPAPAPGVGWVGWMLGGLFALFAGWVASFGRDLRMIREDRRVLLALLFVPGLYLVLALSVVLMLGVAGGLLWLLVLLAEAVHRIPVGLMFAIAIGALLGLWSVLGALWHSVRRAEVQVLAEQLTRADAPGLFAILDRLARRLGTTLPDSVVLEMGTGFFVTEAKVKTFTGTCGRRTLCLSAPLLHVLTVAEVEAILAHEMAHFSGADTAYSRRFYPVFRGASHALEGMSAASSGSDGTGSAAGIPLLLPMLLLGSYLKWFSHLEAKNSREREFRADRLAGEATAPLVMGSALLKVHAYAPLWGGIPEGIKALYRDGKAFVSAAKAFGERARELPELVDGARTGEHYTITHPTDSHPSLAERLQALGLDRATAPLGEGSLATELVGDLGTREERLTDALSFLVLRASGLLASEQQQATADRI